jgi:menaquinol-cytochrome c reductase cytochrome b subunit
VTALGRAQRILIEAVVNVATVLAATGLWLTFDYRPGATQAWPGLGSRPAGTDWPRVIHQLASALIVPLVLALLVVSVVVSRRWRSTGALALTTLALAYTGFLLPWDQLALWAVTVGRDANGMLFAAFDDDVRFIILGGVEISQATLRLWLVVHAAVLPAVFCALLALAARGIERHPSTGAYDAPPAAPAPGPPPTSGARWSNQSRTARS